LADTVHDRPRRKKFALIMAAGPFVEDEFRGPQTIAAFGASEQGARSGKRPEDRLCWCLACQWRPGRKMAKLQLMCDNGAGISLTPDPVRHRRISPFDKVGPRSALWPLMAVGWVTATVDIAVEDIEGGRFAEYGN